MIRNLLVFISLNILFWSYELFFNSSTWIIFDIDLLLLVVIAPFVPRIVSVLWWFLCALTFVLLKMQYIYSFDFIQFWRNFHFRMLCTCQILCNNFFIYFLCISVVGWVVITCVGVFKTRYRWKDWIVLAVLFATVMCVDQMNDHSQLARRSSIDEYISTKALNINTASSPSINVVLSLIPVNNEVAKVQHVGNGERAVDHCFFNNGSKELDDNVLKMHNIVMVEIESLGVFKDDAVNQKVIEPLMTLPGIRFTQGNIPFLGVTESGELRELCGLKRGKNAQVDQIDTEQCLPALLQKHGFLTIAAHANTGSFYNRDIWYPKVGFEETLFRETLDQQGRKVCGGYFRGLCDKDMVKIIHERLLDDDGDKKFIYLMTLHTHLPLVIDKPNDELLQKCERLGLEADDVTLCGLQLGYRSIFKRIGNILSDSHLDKTLVLVVGDHAPPFATKWRKDLVYPDVVPYYCVTMDTKSRS